MNNIKAKLAIVIALAGIALSACDKELQRGMNPVRVESSYTEEGSRIKVKLVNEIRDPIAYNSVRGVYIITDTKTGIEYIGVSGIGISEIGSHANGKSRRMDER